jgi:hypothetical protein
MRLRSVCESIAMPNADPQLAPPDHFKEFARAVQQRLARANMIVHARIGDENALGQVEQVDWWQTLDGLAVVGEHAVMPKRSERVVKGVRACAVIDDMHAFAGCEGREDSERFTPDRSF